MEAPQDMDIEEPTRTGETHEILTGGKTQEDRTWNFKIKPEMFFFPRKKQVGKNVPLG